MGIKQLLRLSQVGDEFVTSSGGKAIILDYYQKNDKGTNATYHHGVVVDTSGRKVQCSWTKTGITEPRNSAYNIVAKNTPPTFTGWEIVCPLFRCIAANRDGSIRAYANGDIPTLGENGWIGYGTDVTEFFSTAFFVDSFQYEYTLWSESLVMRENV